MSPGLLFLALGVVVMVIVHHKAAKAGWPAPWVPMAFVGVAWLMVGVLVGAIA